MKPNGTSWSFFQIHDLKKLHELQGIANMLLPTAGIKPLLVLILLLLLSGCGKDTAPVKEVKKDTVVSAKEMDAAALVAALTKEANASIQMRRPRMSDGIETFAPPSPQLEHIVNELVSSLSPQIMDLLSPVIETGSEEEAFWASEVLGRKQDSRAILPIWNRYVAKHSRPLLRQHLRDIAARLPRELTVRFLAEKLSNENYQIRMAACEMLETCPDPQSVPALCDVMASCSTAERDKAVDALVRIGEKAVPTLLKHAAAKRSNKQSAAIMALGRIPSKNAVRKVFELSISDDPAVSLDARNALISSLSKNENQSADENAYSQRDKMEQVAFQVISTGMSSVNEKARIQALDFIGIMEMAKAGEFIRIIAQRDASDKVRAYALRIMNRNGDPVALEHAFKSLVSDKEHMRQEATAIIIRVISNDHLARLKPAINHSNPDVRRAAMRILGRLDTPQARTILVAHTRDSNEKVIIEACCGLYRMKRLPEDIQWLRQLSKSASRDVRWEVIRILGDWGGFDAVTVLVDLLAHPDGRTRNAAAAKINDSSDPRVFKPLFEIAVQNASGGIAQSVPKALIIQADTKWQELLPLLDSNQPDRKAVAAKVLEKVAVPVVKRKFRQLTLARDRIVSCNASHALLDPPDKQIVDVMIDMMWNSEWGHYLAGCFLNSSVSSLNSNSIKWYKEHGYNVFTLPVFKIPAK
ncbi:MAG: HEAT repeat domain-containing protein [Lentisphaerae bacterium]|nr:HEAT repeat domain-containing protein [Lentisphaerota bacterium]